MLKIKRLLPQAQIPKKNNPSDAAFDLYSAESYTLLPGERHCYSTGISIALEPGTYGQIAPRSGLALKHGIDTMAGVIDNTYRGTVGVILINHGKIPLLLNIGDRIAQLIVLKLTDDVEMVEVADLEETNRGNMGFGSSGLR